MATHGINTVLCHTRAVAIHDSDGDFYGMSKGASSPILAL